MPTDYVLFNHGVNTRNTRPQPDYADALFAHIQKHYHQVPGRTLKKIALYWGDVNKEQEQKLLDAYQGSSIWNNLWFQLFRGKQVMQFVGDGALYVSRYGGARIAEALEKQTIEGLQEPVSGEDRLHIVTHSMGTVILFDMLFSARWDPDYAPGHASVATIREALFGVSPSSEQGIRISSITTMGSPIGFFSLMDVDQSTEDAKDDKGNIICTHDVTPRLQKLLASLYQDTGKKLPWYNIIHPGDPVAYPVEKLLPQLVDVNNQYIDVYDILTHSISVTDFLTEPLSQTLFALLHGGEAHTSYWNSDEVAKKIAQAIEQALQLPAVNKAA